jgi:hypothetical protein
VVAVAAASGVSIATDGVNENLLVYLFCRLINIFYLAYKSPDHADPGVIEVVLYDPGAPAGGAAESGGDSPMSYVAEWRGGGPQDLLRGFDSFRNCNKYRIYI